MKNDFRKNRAIELKKHVATIHSNNSLSLVQRKIANALLFNAYEHLLTKEEHAIEIKVLTKLIGYDSKDTKKIKEALVALISTVIEWNLVEGNKVDEEGVWNASSIIADASIKGGICTYSYSNRMRKLLYRPELYGRLDMDVMSKFKSSYGLALYENCIRYQDINVTARFEMVIFRKLMGVEEGTYTIFRDFKRRVIDIAVNEVNKYSPISVQAKFEKHGREVKAIQFLIEKNKQTPKHDAITSSDDILTYKLKDTYGLSDSQIKNVISNYSKEYLQEKINIIESSSTYQKGEIKNLQKYLEKALVEDFKPAKTNKDIVTANLKERELKENEAKLRQEKLEKYQKYLDQEIQKIYSNLNQKEKNELLKEFETKISKTLFHSIFIKEGLNNPLVNDKFCMFIKAEKQLLLKDLLRFDDYLQ